ncbi:MAG: GNAT family N-acetyltransferase [Alphaproteobacteria bacterium]|nr:GNAT family N-acetyltransferase [Alphaproteobacteria bacterium]
MHPDPIPALKAGSLEVRLAETAAEVDASQVLRYQVFYDEMGAVPTTEMAEACRDFDVFDEVCDHLLVIDHKRDGVNAGVVGTYRLMRREHAQKAGRFYSSSEYDIRPLLAHPKPIMELGRSCVDLAYRARASTMQMLWAGIAAYVFKHGIDIMFGCASLPGTDPSKLALLLSYLHGHHLAPEALRPRALPGLYTAMNLVPLDGIDPKAVQAEMPPLIKGYLRLGGFVGDGAVIDHQFNTTDVAVVVKTDLVSEKYYKHFERTAGPSDNTG